MADFSKFKVGSTSYSVKDALAGKSLSLSGADLSLLKADGSAASTVTLPVGGQPKVVKFDGTRFVMKADTSVNIEDGVSVGDLIIIDCTKQFIDMSQTGSSSNHLDLYSNLNWSASNTSSSTNTYTSKTNLAKYLFICKSMTAVVTGITSGVVSATVMSPPVGFKNELYKSNLGSIPDLTTIQNYLRAFGNIIIEHTNSVSSMFGMKLYDNRDTANPVEIVPENKYGVIYDDLRFASVFTFGSTYNNINCKLEGPTYDASFGVYMTINGYFANVSGNRQYIINSSSGTLYTGKTSNYYMIVLGQYAVGKRFKS